MLNAKLWDTYTRVVCSFSGEQAFRLPKITLSLLFEVDKIIAHTKPFG